MGFGGGRTISVHSRNQQIENKVDQYRGKTTEEGGDASSGTVFVRRGSFESTFARARRQERQGWDHIFILPGPLSKYLNHQLPKGVVLFWNGGNQSLGEKTVSFPRKLTWFRAARETSSAPRCACGNRRLNPGRRKQRDQKKIFVEKKEDHLR